MKAYQELVSGGKYTLDTDRQAQLVRPLALELLNESQRAIGHPMIQIIYTRDIPW